MVAWIASYPRSGNTFLRVLLHRVFGFRTHSVYRVADPTERISNDIGSLLRLVGQTDTDKCDVEMLRAEGGFHFVKTHDLPEPGSSPGIVLVRDGRDAVVSYAYFRLKNEDGSAHPTREMFEKKLLDVITSDAFGGWSGNVEAWIRHLGPESVVRFEDLIKSPERTVAGALERLRISAEPSGPVPSFQELHRSVPWFFRSGKTGVWQHEMPSHLARLFVEKHGYMMDELGYL